MSRRNWRRAQAQKRAIAKTRAERERREGLLPDAAFVRAMLKDANALDWLRQHDPAQARRVERIAGANEGGCECCTSDRVVPAARSGQRDF